MAKRDRVVLFVLGVGALASLLAWHFVGRWPAILLVLVAVGVASVAYRIEAPRIDLDGTPQDWLDAAGRRDEAPAQRVDQ